MGKTITATSALIGTIVGAGFLGIPYVVQRSGFLLGLIHMIVIAGIMIIIMLYLAEVSLRTATKHQLTGYAEKYLGKTGKKLMFMAVAFGIYAAILAYLVAEGQSISQLITGSLSYSLEFGIAFWFLLSLLTYLGIKALKSLEPIGVILIFVMIIAVAVLLAGKIDFTNLQYVQPENMFVPFGVILFAFLGFSIIPEAREIVRGHEISMRKAIYLSNLTALVIYAIFTAVVLGSQGAQTPQIATLALGPAFILLGMITIFTSYLSLSIALLDTFHLDLHYSKVKSWAITTIIPLILFIIIQLTNSAQFTMLLGIGGVISGGLTAILILFMAKSAKAKGDRHPEFKIPYSNIITWLLIIIFSIGAILEIINVFN